MLYLKECTKFTEEDIVRFNKDEDNKLVIVSNDLENIRYIKNKVFISRWPDILRLDTVDGTYIGDKAKIFNISFTGGNEDE